MRPFFTFLFCCSLFLFKAQRAELSPTLKMRLAQSSQSSRLYSLLIKGNMAKLVAMQAQGGYTVHYVSGDIASVSCNNNGINFLVNQKLMDYAELAEPHNKPMNDTMLVRNRIRQVKDGVAPLPRAYNGDSILVGIIDTGIDFNHGDFKDSLGHSRIRFLWDQAPASGSSVPSPYNYGIEWTDAQIDAGSCTHNDLGDYGHGTHVSGIAAGNGLANHSHYGCASNADIVVVALDFNRTGPTIADAVQYIFSKATQMNKPCVINISVGDYAGSHDGTNLEAKLIDNMVSNIPGRVIVAAAGNAGNIRHHVKTQATANDTLFTWLYNSGASEDYYCYADTAQIKNVKISIGANRTSYGDIGRIGFKNYNYGFGTVKTDTLKNSNNNRIGIVKTSASVNAYGVYELYVHIDADTAMLNWRVESTGAGLHHSWNFDFVSAGLPTAAQNPAMAHYVIPDTLYTLVSSFQCSDEIITVGNYVNLNRYYDVTNTLQNTGETTGQIAANSSVGPTRDGRQKPDITASGNNIFSCMALGMQANLLANLPQAVAPGSLHVQGGGTSASSPVVAGLTALYLQRHPTATNHDVKTAIINCAYRDNFTGNQLPDYRWGYGKLDGKATMVCGELNNVGIRELQSNNNSSCYPNPFHTSARLTFEKIVRGKLSVYTVDGRLLFEDVVSSDSYELQGNKLKQYSGLLLLRVTSDSGNFSFRLIKE